MPNLDPSTTGTAKPLTRLGEILEMEGRRQAWLAKKVGTDRSTIHRFVKGLHVPDDMRAPIAEALGREIDDVFPTEPQELAA